VKREKKLNRSPGSHGRAGRGGGGIEARAKVEARKTRPGGKATEKKKKKQGKRSLLSRGQNRGQILHPGPQKRPEGDADENQRKGTDTNGRRRQRAAPSNIQKREKRWMSVPKKRKRRESTR